ncbi:uncharacterized protein LACBIDRAFT_315807 [Laccaria bicolor S238N-H82]|uniref:Predicted protein n=1 Tax=Laccaria bicolor (strain S238N-H82 / ATCC MYA-4686) TaxID=486041 RepID=B0D380_LACBS|nr:uncharacterized protein LACBIDRAFT_315807 [Laccaria bicolor S238N-H82]EDR10868.1 predicted protein [Laccaria bicolor S238N-H82]|eukprot:XP_001878169.1 predicted protein [Laccaria bicolor S238N-H82]
MSALRDRRIKDPMTPMRRVPGYRHALQESIAMTPSISRENHSAAGTTPILVDASPAPLHVPSASSTQTSKRVEVVEGVARGSRPYAISRSRTLPDLLSGQNASKYFNIQMKDIVNRCERLAHATGAWIFFTANHSNARQEFIHYSSPKFRLEAHDAIEGITNEFDSIFDNLITTRRADGFAKQAELRQQLQEKQSQLDSRDVELQETSKVAEELLGRLKAVEAKLKAAGISE